MTRKLISDTRLHCDPDHLSQQVMFAVDPKPTSFNPSVTSCYGRDFSSDWNVLLVRGCPLAAIMVLVLAY